MKIRVSYDSSVKIPAELIRELEGNQLIAKILFMRGIATVEKVREFLNPQYYQPTEPFEFIGMEKAIKIIDEAIKNKEKICIYGDYDVDGVTSTTILVTTLKHLGADVTYHVPNRFVEGYGMNCEVISKLSVAGVKLIITCDCGISNLQEVNLAKELGMKVVVTDHHNLPRVLPDADAIVSPKLLPEDHKAYYLPGAGMAYYLASGILQAYGIKQDELQLLDILSLAIVADVVPIRDENRYLLQKGLPLLSETSRPGLKELFQLLGLNNRKITEDDIGFQIAPRLNAAGRMSSARLSVELLLTTDEKKAKTLARQLEEINTRRKEIGDRMYKEAIERLGEDFDDRPIILYSPGWHEGILGIIAGKLCEEYSVPVLLMGLKEDGKTITGSARSIPGIHIYEVLKQCGNYLNKFGGHEGAAGFSLTHEKLVLFEKAVENILTDKLKRLGGVREIKVDGILPLNRVNLQTYLELNKLAPFGEGNPVPTFLCPDTEIIYKRATADEKHLRLIVKHDDQQFPAIWWWNGTTRILSKVDMVYSIGLNTWQNKQEIQLNINRLINREDLSQKVSNREKKPVFEVLDYRNWNQLGQELPEFSDGVYYFEGLKKPDISGVNVVNRYQMTEKKTLVLLYTPPGLKVLKELIYSHRPEKVVLAYSNRDIISGEDFLKNLSGLVKYVVENKQGRTDIYSLAIMTGQMENTVITGLNFLQDKGLIEIEYITPDNILIKRGLGKKVQNSKLHENKLRELLKETSAFQNYLLRADLELIKELV